MEVKLSTGQAFDNDHGAGAGGTTQAGCQWRIDAGGHAEQFAAARECGPASSVGEEAEVTDANQATGQDMEQEAAQELMG